MLVGKAVLLVGNQFIWWGISSVGGESVLLGVTLLLLGVVTVLLYEPSLLGDRRYCTVDYT